MIGACLQQFCRFPAACKLWVGVGLLTVLPVGAQSAGGWEIDWERVAAETHGAAEVVVEHFSLPVTLPPLEEWGSALHLIEQTLREGDLQDLARLAPYTRQAYAQLRGEARLAPYMDWLGQRLDYFEAAEHFLRPPPPPPTPVPPRGPPRADAPPAPRPRPAPLPVDDTRRWAARARSKPLPPQAEGLVPRLKPIFVAEGIPAEWVWIAEVESTFNPQARSPVGAVGLYQFMPRTAEHLGLQLAPEDERMHPEKSARAAAQYLRYLYGRFQDWPLVLAAYNAGEGRVSGLMRRHGRSFEAISPHLPQETRMYVPKVLGTVRNREGVDAARLPAPTEIKDNQ